jgi:hypothetical protein
MVFGNYLHSDQLECVNEYTLDTLKLVQEIREYIKDRADIEREYAEKVDRLGKLYFKRLKKLSGLFYGSYALRWKEKRNISITTSLDKSTLSSGSTLSRSSDIAPSPPQTGSSVAAMVDDDTASLFSIDEDQDMNTMVKSWITLLREGMISGKSHRILADISQSGTTDPLKASATCMEEYRKKHMQFAAKLQIEFDKVKQEVEKMKLKHVEACKRCDVTKYAYERCPDDLVVERERLWKTWDQAVEAQRQIWNDYLLSVDAANAYQQKYYKEDLPILMDRMQETIEREYHKLKLLLQEHVTHEKDTRLEELKCWERVSTLLMTINEKTDSDLFIKHNKRIHEEEILPILAQQMSSSLSSSATDQQELATHESVIVVLDNKLHKLCAELQDIEPSVTVHSKEIEGLQKLLDAYARQPELGNIDEVQEVCFI